MEKVNKSNAQRWLTDVPAAYTFKCVDGRELKNMSELAKALEQMTGESFLFHSASGRSDFSTWVADIIGDRTLATELAASHTQEQAAKTVAARVALLVKKAQKAGISRADNIPAADKTR